MFVTLLAKLSQMRGVDTLNNNWKNVKLDNCVALCNRFLLIKGWLDDVLVVAENSLYEKTFLV